MKNERVIITVVGVTATLAVAVGAFFVVREVVFDTQTVRAAEIADQCVEYTEKYNEMAGLYYNAMNPKPITTTTIETKITGDVSVTVTQDGTVIADNNGSPDGSVKVDVTVGSDGSVNVGVDVPPEQPPEEPAEQPVIVDGEEIYISQITTVAENGDLIYRIKWGDTLCRISRIFGYSVQELAEYNHIKNPDLIYADSTLRIPTSKSKPNG